MMVGDDSGGQGGLQYQSQQRRPPIGTRPAAARRAVAAGQETCRDGTTGVSVLHKVDSPGPSLTRDDAFQARTVQSVVGGSTSRAPHA